MTENQNKFMEYIVSLVQSGLICKDVGLACLLGIKEVGMKEKTEKIFLIVMLVVNIAVLDYLMVVWAQAFRAFPVALKYETGESLSYLTMPLYLWLLFVVSTVTNIIYFVIRLFKQFKKIQSIK